MPRRRGLRAALSCALFWLGAGCAEEAHRDTAADEPAPRIYRVGEIELIDPWAKSAIGVHEAKLFFEFRNGGGADRLIAARAEVAGGETHFRLVTRGEHGRAVSDLEHIDIPHTRTPYELSEVGYYIELTGVEVPLVMGKEFTVVLEFAEAGRLEVPFTSRFHSPALGRRIRAAAERGDLEALKALRDRTRPGSSLPPDSR